VVFKHGQFEHRLAGQCKYTRAVNDRQNLRAGARDTQLERLESSQRSKEVAADAPVRWEVSRVRIPEAGALPQSQALLERLYDGELVPREKKPQVIDTRRSCGPYMASVDDEPMVLIDACSQIATLTHGFAHPEMVKGIHEGRFADCLWSNPETLVVEPQVLRDYSEALLEHAPAGLAHVAFVCAGGAEANEKAFRLARLQVMRDRGLSDDDPKAPRRVLAFEDSFHGRTWISLMSTWNPAKRGPFELPGYETVFSKPDLGSLAKVLAERGDEVYALILEPMMAEGGDVHLSREFVLGVRELATKYRIPMIADEVQTGFATGAPDFYWWKRLGLGDTPETSPDYVTCAKKAGLGIVLSREKDREPTSVNVVSALRGLIQCETAQEQDPLEAKIRPRLERLRLAHPQKFTNPRVAGTTFAFDLPNAAARVAFINQRFQRGFMTYQAGERTLRFRLNACFSDRLLDDLFARIDMTLTRLEDESATQWEAEGRSRGPDMNVEVVEVSEEDWPAIMVIEDAAYEPERSDSEECLRASGIKGVGLVAKDTRDGTVLGFCFGGLLEKFTDVSGPDCDRFQGTGEGFYSADVTVSPTARGRGIGRALKEAQLDWARARGLRWCTGRNRVGATDEMMALNRSLGAYIDQRLVRQYGGKAEADYYRIPLGAPRLPQVTNDPLDLGSGVQAPFGQAPAFMAKRDLVGPASSRLNLSNWATPDLVHYAEHMRLILPRGCSHMYFTSSRDETCDKALRCLKISRPDAVMAVGFRGGFVGNVTAAARSVSDGDGFEEHFALFDWPMLPHPSEDLDGCLAGLEALVAKHGSTSILGILIETVGERSGNCLEGEAAVALAAACKRHDLPLVLVETAAGYYRSGAGAWGVDSLPDSVRPDLVLWYAGGQLGHVFVNDRYYVAKPLMLISTWDGDEVSIIRTHEGLRHAWRMDLRASIDALDTLVREVAGALGADVDCGGRGLYRTLRFSDAVGADRFRAACAKHKMTLAVGIPGTLVLCPALDIDAAAIRGVVRDAMLASLV